MCAGALWYEITLVCKAIRLVIITAAYTSIMRWFYTALLSGQQTHVTRQLYEQTWSYTMCNHVKRRENFANTSTRARVSSV